MNAVDRLRQLDLNLVVALDVLLEERGVSRAARRIGITQSAMSHTLRRLRETLDDPLLISSRGSSAGVMALTPRAEALRQPLREGLLCLDRALAPPQIDAATASWTFRVAAPDLVELLVLPQLSARLREHSPKSTLVFRGYQFGRPLEEDLQSGAVDLALVPPAAVAQAGHLRARVALRSPLACFLRQGHPLLDEAQQLSRAAYVAAQHVMVSPSGHGPGPVDHALAAEGAERTVSLRVSSFAMAPAVLASTDLVLTAPALMATVVSPHLDVHVCPVPLALPDRPITMAWHPRFDDEPRHRWLRERVLEVCGGLTAPPALTR